MLEPPDIQKQVIIACLEQSYDLQVKQLTFLPLGVDVNAAVFRVDTHGASAYFLKLRKGAFDPIAVSVPLFLKSQDIPAIIAPLESLTHQPWVEMDGCKLILYPFIQGQDGYARSLTGDQWHDFGAAFKSVHAVKLPAALALQIPRETFSPYWLNVVKKFQTQVEYTRYADPVAAALADFMQTRRDEINRLVERCARLGLALKAQPQPFVLCHADLHPGNLLIGDRDLYIVDWDEPLLALKERDLALLGGCTHWQDPHDIDQFYQGYGQAPVDPAALAYYRFDRIIRDIAAFCQQLLESEEGGKDREQSFAFFASNFLPGHEIDLAMRADEIDSY